MGEASVMLGDGRLQLQTLISFIQEFGPALSMVTPFAS